MRNTNYDIDLIINSLGRGGAERVCVNIANEMARRGLKVRIICLRKVKNNYEKNVIKKVSIFHIGASKDIFGLIKLKKIIKTDYFKRIVAFDERIAAICNYANIKYDKKIRIISRMINNVDYQERENKSLIYKLIYVFSKKYYKYSDIFIFQCSEMKRRMTEYFNLPKESKRLFCINNPLSEEFNNVPICKNKDDYFIAIGRLSEQKGYDSMLKAIIKCKGEGKLINLKIIGDGPLRQHIDGIIKANKINVQLVGSTENVKKYYTHAKAIILTSNYEGFPNVLIEAIACGCPIISYDCPTGPSEIINNNNGILIKSCSEEELSARLMTFDDIKWDYAAIKNGASKYNSKKIIDDYIKAIIG